MKRRCTLCGERYQAKRSTSRYCSNACRQRAHRQRHPPERSLNSEIANLLTKASNYLEAAGDYVHGNVLDDALNDWAWATVESLRDQVERIAERVHPPEFIRGDGVDDELAKRRRASARAQRR